MTTDNVTAENLDEKIFEAAKNNLGRNFDLVKIFLWAESEKLAITLRMIFNGLATGEISKVESKILLNQQKIASSAILTAVEGMSAVAIQGAIKAAFKVVKDFVNGKAGFPLL